MKIAINGDIIETRHIWKIDKVTTSGSFMAQFTIHFFDRKSITICKRTDYTPIIDGSPAKYLGDTPERFKEIIEEMKSFRADILAEWIEDQTALPLFELEGSKNT